MSLCIKRLSKHWVSFYQEVLQIVTVVFLSRKIDTTPQKGNFEPLLIKWNMKQYLLLIITFSAAFLKHYFQFSFFSRFLTKFLIICYQYYLNTYNSSESKLGKKSHNSSTETVDTVKYT